MSKKRPKDHFNPAHDPTATLRFDNGMSNSMRNAGIEASTLIADLNPRDYVDRGIHRSVDGKIILPLPIAERGQSTWACWIYAILSLENAALEKSSGPLLAPPTRRSVRASELCPGCGLAVRDRLFPAHPVVRGSVVLCSRERVVVCDS